MSGRAAAQVIYKKFLGSSLTDEEAQHLKEIMMIFWYDLEVLSEEKQLLGCTEKLHFELIIQCTSLLK